MKPIDRDPAPSREEALYLARRNGHGGELEGQAPGDWAMRLALGASRVLRTHWRVVAAAGFSAMFVTYCLTKFCMTRIYRAQTLVRPASQEPQSSVSLGALSTMTTSMVPLQMLFGQSAASDEQEFEAILGSVAFADELVKKHNLFDVFYNQKRGFVGRIIRSTFRFIFGARQGQGSSRFDNYYAVSNGLWWEFDKSTGNMNIYFADPNPRAAVRVLTLIIRDLREQIRNRVRLADRKSIDALQAEILGARDPQLVANLEQLLAQQMQDLERQKRARTSLSSWKIHLTCPPALTRRVPCWIQLSRSSSPAPSPSSGLRNGSRNWLCRVELPAIVKMTRKTAIPVST